MAAPRRNADGTKSLVFEPNSINVRAGGLIAFCNCTASLLMNTDSLDVVFSDPSAVEEAPPPYNSGGGGNIAPFVHSPDGGFFSAFRGRLFPKAGTYTFRSLRHGTGGTIVVTE
jgi:hypothetical protein